MKVTVVILNWNGRPMLERFLPSVIANTNAEVVVADNGSTDDSVAFMKEHYPQIRLILFDRNYGFAEGYNKALAQLEADYFVLLNDDVECTPHWVEPVIEMMEEDARIAIAQPKLLMYNQKDTFEYAGAAGGMMDLFGYPFCRGRLFMTLEKDEGQYNKTCDIFWATGAAMFVRASAWKEIGGLDGDFFAHMEEIDFCWRTKLAGYRVVYCPSSVLYHVGGGTLPKSNPFKTQLNFRNNLSMLYKNLPASRRWWLMPLRKVLDWVAALKFLAEGHKGEFDAVIKAHKEFNERKSSLREKRARNKSHHVGQTYKGLLLIEYYFFHRQKFTDLKGDWTK